MGGREMRVVFEMVGILMLTAIMVGFDAKKEESFEATSAAYESREYVD
jgi:hypothetical protein